ncbi:MAG: HAD family phosphatase [Bacteroidales bacterium]|nr:HAD family phosphatase [Bacteroidales bacterium]
MKTSRFSEFIDALPFTVEAFLFDLDGVLVNSEGVYQQYWEGVARETGKDPAVFPFIIKGVTLDEIVARHFPEADRARIKQGFVNLQLHMEYELLEGALQMLEACRKHHMKTAIVTSSDKEKMKVVCQQHPCFNRLTDALITAEATQRKKPAPDCWLKAAEVLRVDIKRCVIFEDSANGLQSALASGGYVVGLTTTHKPEEIKSLCHYMISNLSALT